MSRDCRTALQICRSAVEIVQKEIKDNGIDNLLSNDNHNNKRTKTRSKGRTQSPMDSFDDREEQVVTLHHLKMAKDSFDQSNDVQIVSTLSIYEKLRVHIDFLIVCWLELW